MLRITCPKVKCKAIRYSTSGLLYYKKSEIYREQQVTVIQKKSTVPTVSTCKLTTGYCCTILHLIFLLSTTFFLLQLTHADMFDFSSSNYVPKYRPDFSLHDIPCDLSEAGSCARPGKSYPWYGMQNFIRDNQAMIKRMYGDTCTNPSQLKAQGPMETRSQYARSAVVNACPSEQFVITPFWANNSAGTTLAVVNFHPFEQAVQQEVCKSGSQGRCRDGCLCEQKYSWYRLLAFDPRNECRGIFMDWFQFPSCCACHCYDLPSSEKDSSDDNNHTSAPELPSPKMGVFNSTPLPTLTVPTISTIAVTNLSLWNDQTDPADYDNNDTMDNADSLSSTATTFPSTSSKSKNMTNSTAKTFPPVTSTTSAVTGDSSSSSAATTQVSATSTLPTSTTPFITTPSPLTATATTVAASAPAQATGTLKFPAYPNSQILTDYINTNNDTATVPTTTKGPIVADTGRTSTTKHALHNTTPNRKTAIMAFRHRFITLPQIKANTAFPSQQQSGEQQPTGTTVKGGGGGESTTQESSLNELYAELWRSVDPAMRRNRVPRI